MAPAFSQGVHVNDNVIFLLAAGVVAFFVVRRYSQAQGDVGRTAGGVYINPATTPYPEAQAGTSDSPQNTGIVPPVLRANLPPSGGVIATKTAGGTTYQTPPFNPNPGGGGFPTGIFGKSKCACIKAPCSCSGIPINPVERTPAKQVADSERGPIFTPPIFVPGPKKANTSLSKIFQRAIPSKVFPGDNKATLPLSQRGTVLFGNPLTF